MQYKKLCTSTQIQGKLTPHVTVCIYMQKVHRVDASIILGLYYA